MRWLILVSLLCGCASTQVIETAAPSPTYEETILARVEAATNASPYTLRHNPTDCRCPEFEIRLGDHWHRVELRADDPEAPELQVLLNTIKESTDQAGRTYAVEGTLSDEIGVCGAGAYTVSLEPSDVQGSDVTDTPKTAP